MGCGDDGEQVWDVQRCGDDGEQVWDVQRCGDDGEQVWDVQRSSSPVLCCQRRKTKEL